MKGTHNSVGIEDSTFTEIRVAYSNNLRHLQAYSVHTHRKSNFNLYLEGYNIYNWTRRRVWRICGNCDAYYKGVKRFYTCYK